MSSKQIIIFIKHTINIRLFCIFFSKVLNADAVAYIVPCTDIVTSINARTTIENMVPKKLDAIIRWLSAKKFKRFELLCHLIN